MRLLRPEDRGDIQATGRRGPGAALPTSPRGLANRPNNESFFEVFLEQFLRGFVGRLDVVVVPHGAAHELPVRLVEFADLQHRADARAAISTFPAQVGMCVAAGAFAFAKSWLARKPQNMTAIPTNSPIYSAHGRLKRAREPPAAMMSAPIPIQRLNINRVRQYEYAAIPMRATLPGIVKRGEKMRTLSGSAVPATGIGEEKAAVATVAPATATANPAKTTIV